MGCKGSKKITGEHLAKGGSELESTKGDENQANVTEDEIEDEEEAQQSMVEEPEPEEVQGAQNGDNEHHVGKPGKLESQSNKLCSNKDGDDFIVTMALPESAKRTKALVTGAMGWPTNQGEEKFIEAVRNDRHEKTVDYVKSYMSLGGAARNKMLANIQARCGVTCAISDIVVNCDVERYIQFRDKTMENVQLAATLLHRYMRNDIGLRMAGNQVGQVFEDLLSVSEAQKWIQSRDALLRYKSHLYAVNGGSEFGPLRTNAMRPTKKCFKEVYGNARYVELK